MTDASSSNHSVLSEKVNRALQVRTDTPAMKAALEALAHLPHTTTMAAASAGGTSASKNVSNPQEDVIVDSRSVRVAIEQDALQQALALQEKLQSLVSTISTLREGVASISSIADHLSHSIHADVMVPSASAPVMLPPEAKLHDNMPSSTADTEAAILQDPNRASSSSNLDESQLASMLAESFLQRDVARKRLEAVQTFLDKFDLREQDSRLLDHYNFEDMMEPGNIHPVNGMAFLEALRRVVHIRRALGHAFDGTQQGTTTMTSPFAGNNDSELGASSALRMMETLAQKQERAYERLYHWLQKYLRLHPSSVAAAQKQQQDQQQAEFDYLDEALSHPFCKLALKTLKNVPAFHSHTLELIANSRRTQETKQFLLALTSGYGGFPPMEMKAHDAVAYVGDMLAFCFRAFSVEADVTKGLITDQATPDEDEDKVDEQEEKEDIAQLPVEAMELLTVDKPMTGRDILSLSMSGVARPLKSRILQVVSTLARTDNAHHDDESVDELDDLDEEGTVVRSKVNQLYEICGLLLFYANAMETVEGKLDPPTTEESEAKDDNKEATTNLEPNPLIVAVLDCLAEATNAYEATFRVYASMLEQLSLLTGTSEAILAHMIVQMITQVREASPGFATDVNCPAEFQTILSLEFFMDVLMEASLSHCKALDDVVALKQSVSVANKAGLTTTSKLHDKINEREVALIQELVESETTQVLELCGLGSLTVAWKRYQEAAAGSNTTSEASYSHIMAAYPGLGHDDVEMAMKDFYASLFSPPLPSLEARVKDPLLRKSARKKIAQRVCEVYAGLYNALKSEEAGYEDTSFLGHTPEQVSTLFST